MFEFDVAIHRFEFNLSRLPDGWSSRLRIGRLHLRTWPPFFMALPKRYDSPVLVYLVEEEFQGEIRQIGAFFDEPDAMALQNQLTSEGRDARLNLVFVHRRFMDHEFDR